jgi:hypothetical protein
MDELIEAAKVASQMLHSVQADEDPFSMTWAEIENLDRAIENVEMQRTASPAAESLAHLQS